MQKWIPPAHITSSSEVGPRRLINPFLASAHLSVPDGITGDTKMAKERALPITHARLNVGGFDKTMEVMDEITEVTFTVLLTKGECKILAELIGAQAKRMGPIS